MSSIWLDLPKDIYFIYLKDECQLDAKDGSNRTENNLINTIQGSNDPCDKVSFNGSFDKIDEKQLYPGGEQEVCIISLVTMYSTNSSLSRLPINLNFAGAYERES